MTIANCIGVHPLRNGVVLIIELVVVGFLAGSGYPKSNHQQIIDPTNIWPPSAKTQ